MFLGIKKSRSDKFINMKKIIVYATGENGDGRVMQIGEFDSLEEMEIIVGLFDKDVILNFEYSEEDIDVN